MKKAAYAAFFFIHKCYKSFLKVQLELLSDFILVSRR
jgi:hypothetical protein